LHRAFEVGDFGGSGRWGELEPVAFRKGIDGLAALCRQALASDPLAGTLFVFCSRRRHALKRLIYDGQGCVLTETLVVDAEGIYVPRLLNAASARRPARL
jgi:transposase